MKDFSDFDVVVIGAGAAGLSATSEIIQKKKSVICVEASNTIGGRCYTDNSIFGLPCDLGAHWLHSFSGNQIAEYGKKQKEDFRIYKINEKFLVYDGKKQVNAKHLFKIINTLKSLKEKYSNKVLYKKCIDVPFSELIPNEIKQNEWYHTAHQAIGACLEGVDFDNFTTADAYLNFKNTGVGDGFVKEGYGTLLAHYRKNLPVRFNTIVSEIDWSGPLLKIKTNLGTIKSKACIVTVSTGVLNSGLINFKPLLPTEKYEAFAGVNLGFYNHIILQFKEGFYKYFNIQKDEYFFSKINSLASFPRGFFGTLKLHNSNLSYFDVGGKFALELEKEGQKACVDFAINTLKSSFGNIVDKYLIKSHATLWGKNKFFSGAYSSAQPGKAHLRKNLKSSIADKIFFAGEAISKNYGTVHGADISGKECALKVFETSKL